MNDEAHRLCPDCGVENPLAATECSECHHPLIAWASTTRAGFLRRPRPPRPGLRLPGVPEVVEEEGKVIPRRRHGRASVLGMGGGDDRPRMAGESTTWIWVIVGAMSLIAVLVAAIGITTRPAPFSVPGASPVQANLADSLHKIIERDTTQYEATVRLANLLYDTQNFERAVPFYRRALSLRPDEVDVRVDLAVSLHQSGHTGEALAELDQVLAVQPDHAIARFDLGVIYEFMGRYDEAETAYRAVLALEVQPEMAHATEQRLRAVESKRESQP